MVIEEPERQLILGALNSLGVALADHDHKWTVGERAIHEEGVRVLTSCSATRRDFGSTVPAKCQAPRPSSEPHLRCDPALTQLPRLVYLLWQAFSAQLCRLASKVYRCFSSILSYFVVSNCLNRNLP